MIKEPDFINRAQETVFGYLLSYIGNMKSNEVRHFLRYVTGSSALVVDAINVRYNGLSGFSRRPISHTCTSVLELPTTYATSLELTEEFDAILSSEMAWILNAL